MSVSLFAPTTLFFIFYLYSCDDAWVDTAYDCLEFIPKGLSLAGETPPDFPPSSQDKIRLYTIISNYYSSRTEPLLSSTNQDLHTGILNLLMQRKLDIALEAVQLSFVLLPRQLREEVQSLLRFMYAVAHDKDVHLSNKVSILIFKNIFPILKLFVKANWFDIYLKIKKFLFLLCVASLIS